MRFTAAIACLLVAHDCAMTASGLQSQNLFATEALWVWWIAAALWLVSAFRVFFNGAA
jgi:hypothetical protein